MMRIAIDTGEKLVFYAGGSMWPTFRAGDRFAVEECDAASLLPGEIVVFRGGDGGTGDRLITHRVLRITRRNGGTWVRTQGDCSRRPDPDWPGDRLVGRVVEVSPVRGRPRKLAPRPFLGWRLRHRLSLKRITRGLRRRAAMVLRRTLRL